MNDEPAIDDQPTPTRLTALARMLLAEFDRQCSESRRQLVDGLVAIGASPAPAAAVSPPVAPSKTAGVGRKYDRVKLVDAAKRALDEGRSLTAALADEFGMSKMTAQTYVSDMRKRGDIPPARTRPRPEPVMAPVVEQPRAPRPAEAPLGRVGQGSVLACNDCEFETEKVADILAHARVEHGRPASKSERTPVPVGRAS